MKAIVKNFKHNITINDIKEELKYNPVEKFEYGDFDNWVTALVTDINVYKINELPDGAVSKYSVTIETSFKYINGDGTVNYMEYKGYNTYYVNSLDEDFIEIDGYAFVVD